MSVPVYTVSVGGRVVNWVRGLEYVILQEADILNASFRHYGGAVKDLILAAVDLGIVVIAAAGNDNATILVPPARYEGVISVGGMHQSHVRWSGSNYGPDIDLVEDLFIAQSGHGHTWPTASTPVPSTLIGRTARALWTRLLRPRPEAARLPDERLGQSRSSSE